MRYGKALCGYFDELGLPVLAASAIFFTGLDGDRCELDYYLFCCVVKRTEFEASFVQDILPTEVPTKALLQLVVPPVQFLQTLLEVTCETNTFLLGRSVYLYVKYKNGVVQPLDGKLITAKLLSPKFKLSPHNFI